MEKGQKQIFKQNYCMRAKNQPLSPKSDQHEFSCNSTYLRETVMRVDEMIRDMLWSVISSLNLAHKEMYGNQWEKFVCGSWGLKI